MSPCCYISYTGCQFASGSNSRLIIISKALKDMSSGYLWIHFTPMGLVHPHSFQQKRPTSDSIYQRFSLPESRIRNFSAVAPALWIVLLLEDCPHNFWPSSSANWPQSPIGAHYAGLAERCPP